MSDEIKIRVNFDVTTTQGTTLSRAANYNADMVGSLLGFHTEVVTASEGQVSTGSDLATSAAGFYVIRNLGTSIKAQDTSYTEAADYVTIGKQGNHVMKLLPKETILMRGNGEAIYATAVAGTAHGSLPDTHIEVVCLEG